MVQIIQGTKAPHEEAKQQLAKRNAGKMEETLKRIKCSQPFFKFFLHIISFSTLELFFSIFSGFALFGVITGIVQS